MRKTIRNIVLIAVALFACNIENIDAADIAKTCKYNTPSSTAKENQTSVLCNIYTDNSHQCYMQVGGQEATTSSNKESILNWKEKLYGYKAIDDYKATGNCPEYLVAEIDDCIGCYNIWSFNDYSVAQQTKTEREKYKNTVIANLNKGGTAGEQQLDDIINAITQIKNEYGFNSENQPKCLFSTDDYGYIMVPQVSAKEKCKPQIEKNLQLLSNYKSQVQSLIDSDEKLPGDKLRNFNQLYEETLKFFNEENTKIEDFTIAMDNGKDFYEAMKIYHGNVVKPGGDIDVDSESITCEMFKETKTGDIIRWIIKLIQIAIPVIIIIMTIVDFAGVAISGEEKNFKAAGNKFMKRLVIGIAFILLPMLLTFIIDFSGALEPYGIERNQLFCSLFS